MSLKQTVNIKLDNRYSATWHKYEGRNMRMWLRGTVFMDGKFCQEDALPFSLSGMAELLNDKKISDSLITSLKEIKGFFAIVIQKDETVFASVDRVRSIPIFYGQAKEKVFLSDDAEWVRKQVGDTDMDFISRQEFLCAGYVTGSRTLFPNVRQLQAGEMLFVTQSVDGPKIEADRYYRFFHSEPSDPVDEKALLTELDYVSEKCVRRLIEYADGRQIVVPLSGGLDSRLIVTLLRRMDYENVLTFSYGVPGNEESKISQAVAQSLQYPWDFVKYSRRLWRLWWTSPEKEKYHRFASGWSSLPHLQDWPAVWVLGRLGKFSGDAVFAPGHSADLLAGSRSKSVPEIYERGIIDLELVQKEIIRYHYSLSDWGLLNHDLKSQFCSFIFRSLGQTSNYQNNSDIFEAWDIAERQAKFIINSVRVYEFWGFDWWLPWWDKAFMEFWEKVPLDFRVGKHLYERYVNEVFQNIAAMPINRHAIKMQYKLRDLIANRVTSIIKNTKAYKPAKNLYTFLMLVFSYWTHFLCWYGIYPFNNFFRLIVITNAINTPGFCINTLLSKEIISNYKENNDDLGESQM